MDTRRLQLPFWINITAQTSVLCSRHSGVLDFQKSNIYVFSSKFQHSFDILFLSITTVQVSCQYRALVLWIIEFC